MSSKTSHDSETPAHGQQVITAAAFIHRLHNGEHQVFLPKRAKTKKFLPDVFEMPGGHIDYGEDIVDGLKREIKEELKMKIRVGDPFRAFTYQNLVKKSHSIEVVYFATFVNPLTELTIQAEDHSTYGWFNKSEAIELFSHRLTKTNRSNYVQRSDGEDQELSAILKGFALLDGKPFDTAV